MTALLEALRAWASGLGSDAPRRSAALPDGLDGIDARWSRSLSVPDPDGTARRWHILDNDAALNGAPTAGTLLCVHGNPTWSYLWRHLIARATAADRPWRVIAVDQLDMGFSERTGSTRRLGRRIDDLGGLTEALGLIGPVVTVGHDWGGAISLGWALGHPDQLAGVILLNTAVHQPAGSAIPGLIAAARLPGVRWAVTAATPLFLRATLALAHPRLPSAIRSAYLAPYRGRSRRAAIDTFVEDIPLSPRHPSWPALTALVAGLPALAEVPSLLLWGPRDPVFSDLYLRDLRERLPHAEVHRFETAGHLLAEDVDVAGAVFDWLSTSFPAATSAPAIDVRSQTVVGATPRRALWAELAARADDRGTALVEAGRGGQPGVQLNWQELNERINRAAGRLVEAGVGGGDRVALLVPPGADLTVALYACLRIGAVVVIADAGLGLSGLHRAVRGAGVQHVIGIDRALAIARILRWPGRRITVAPPGPLRHAVLGTSSALIAPADAGASPETLPPAPEPDDDAMVIYTSGATGPAKGVVYTHRQLEAVRDVLSATYSLRPDDRFVAAFAPFALFGPALGTASVVPDMDVTAPRTLTTAALADAASAVRATVVFASPAALTNVMATAADLDPDQRAALRRVRLLLSAGAPVPTALLTSLQTVMPNAKIHTPYGMTEMLLISDVELADLKAAGLGDGVLVGRPVAGVEVLISPLDAAGAATDEQTAKPGVTGEILARAAHGKARYDQLWVTENATRPAPGWHRTGDIGHFDDEGRLWVEGRLVHVVSTAEGFVTPVGIEQRIETLPEVSRAAVVGVGRPGDQHLVVVLETVVPASVGVAEVDLSARVRAVANARLAAVLITDRLRTDIRHNSKIDRAEVARWAGHRLAGDPGAR